MGHCGLIFMQVSIIFFRNVLAVDTLMRWEGLLFLASDLLNVYGVQTFKIHFIVWYNDLLV